MPGRSAKCVKCGEVVNDGAAVARAAAASPEKLAGALVCGRCSGHGSREIPERGDSIRRAAFVTRR